eukprot:4151502-Karenia_brevis.AAC.1
MEGSQHDRFPGVGDVEDELPDFEDQGGGSPPQPAEGAQVATGNEEAQHAVIGQEDWIPAEQQ